MTAFKFTTLSNAREFRYKMNQYSKFSIVLGDNELFWIVTNKEASKLVKAGYEMAE